MSNSKTSPEFDPLGYKLRSKANWNTVASKYHRNWADGEVGPFKSTSELVNAAGFGRSDMVLDIACGTGAVSKQVISHMGRDGRLIGIDFSRTALAIAKKFVGSQNASFFEMDAENMEFRTLFDKILCQYGLMFFPNSGKVLQNAKKMLKKNGMMAIAVHGSSEEVPYFSSIMNPILRHIPDIRPKGTPNVHRFGKPSDLEREISEAGFSDVTIIKHLFSYEAGTFDEYWRDYMNSTANSLRPTIEGMGSDIVSAIRDESKLNVSDYLSNGKIIFPWTILIASAH